MQKDTYHVKASAEFTIQTRVCRAYLLPVIVRKCLIRQYVFFGTFQDFHRLRNLPLELLHHDSQLLFGLSVVWLSKHHSDNGRNHRL